MLILINTFAPFSKGVQVSGKVYSKSYHAYMKLIFSKVTGKFQQFNICHSSKMDWLEKYEYFSATTTVILS